MSLNINCIQRQSGKKQKKKLESNKNSLQCKEPSGLAQGHPSQRQWRATGRIKSDSTGIPRQNNVFFFTARWFWWHYTNIITPTGNGTVENRNNETIWRDHYCNEEVTHESDLLHNENISFQNNVEYNIVQGCCKIKTELYNELLNELTTFQQSTKNILESKIMSIVVN